MWYYADKGQHSGPYDEPALDKLLADGVITPETHVWKEGLPEWVPLKQARPLAVTTPAEAAAMTCGLCGKKVGVDNLIELMGIRVCSACKPMAVQTLREGAIPLTKTATAWADGKKVITHDKAVLPPRCFKCNGAPDGGPRKRKVYWHSPWWYLVLLLPFRIIIYIIVAIFVRKQGTIELFLCANHARQRIYFMIAGWGGFIVGLSCLVTGIAAQMTWLAIAGGLVIVVAIVAMFRTAIFRTVLIKDKTITLKGAGKEFLGSLPLWPG